MTAVDLVPLPVVLPLLGAGATLALGRWAGAQRVVSVVVLTASVAVAAILLVGADSQGPLVLWVGGWPEPLGISLVADRLSALMLLVSATVTLAVLVYSLGQGVADGTRNTPVSIYHPTYLVLSAGVANAFLAGDLFNLFVGFEVLLAASYVLMTLTGTGERIQAGTTYVVVSLLSSLLFLIAIALVYAATGTVNLAHLSGRLADLPGGASLLLQLLLLTVFSIKAAVFPLSAWLPDSYPTAPAPVTAVFAGLLTKVGVYAIIRTQTLLFPDSPLTGLLMWAALLTMIVGILGAVAQSEIKRMLSFTLVSHVGYMVFGVALATAPGLGGAIFYVVHHITIQTTLFLVAGLVERRGGSTSLNQLGGLAKASPVLGVLFFVPAMNLAGIPPFSGFLGKLGLLQAGVAVGSPLAYVLVVGGVATSLLTLYAIAKAWNLAFWRAVPAEILEPAPDARKALRAGPADGLRHGADPDEPPPAPPVALPGAMVAPTAGLVVAGVALSVVAGPLFGVADRAAADLLERSPYVESVLPGGAP
ncbi:MAG TPA: Na+/H+ antiporter subunit D [Jiangellaceae bacterium]|nr:Na+/H+ antiporter subunit D [Jiangellaceae bacterium]